MQKVKSEVLPQLFGVATVSHFVTPGRLNIDFCDAYPISWTIVEMHAVESVWTDTKYGIAYEFTCATKTSQS